MEQDGTRRVLSDALLTSPNETFILEKNPKYCPKTLEIGKNRSRFAQKADQTKFTIEQDRTQYALCDVLLTFPNDLFILEKNPKYCRKALETGEKPVAIR